MLIVGLLAAPAAFAQPEIVEQNDYFMQLSHLLQSPDPGDRLRALQLMDRLPDARMGAKARPLLADPSPEVRAVAADVLGKYRLFWVAPALIALLKDVDPTVREHAAKALRWTANRQAVEPLLALLQDLSPALRAAALTGLSGIPDSRSLQPTVPMLRDPSPAVRAAAARLFGHSFNGDSRWWTAAPQASNESLMVHFMDAQTRAAQQAATAARVTPLLRDEDALVRGYAAVALTCYGDRTVLPELLNALSHPDANLRADAARAFPRLVVLSDPKLLDLLIVMLEQEADPDVRLALIDALGARRNRRVVLPLLPFLADPATAVRIKTVQALGNFPERQTLEALLPLLQDQDAAVRAAVLGALTNFDARAVADPLLKALQDRDFRVRRQAADSLAKLKIRQAVVPLIALIQESPLEERPTLIESVCRIGDPAVIGPLLKIPRNRVEINVALAIGLAQIDDPGIVDPLLSWVHDHSPVVRSCARTGLGAVIHAGAGERLLPLLRDPDVELRDAILSLLANTEVDIPGFETAVIPLLADENQGIRSRAIYLVKKYRMREATDALHVMALNDPQVRLRVAAAEALVKIHEPGTEYLLEFLSSRTVEVQRSAIRGASGNTDPRIFDTLLGLVNDRAPATRGLVLQALGTHQNPRAVPALLEALHEPSVEIRVNAASALAYATTAEVTTELLAVARDDTAPTVRAAALTSLAVRKEVGVVEMQLAALQDPDVMVQAAAGAGLAAIQEPRAIDGLLAMLQSEDAAVQDAAQHALARYDDSRVITALVKLLKAQVMEHDVETLAYRIDHPVIMQTYPGGNTTYRMSIFPLPPLNLPQRAGQLLQEMGEVVTPAALDMLNDGQPAVRAVGALLLGQYSDERAIPALAAAVQDPVEQVRQMAVRALGKTGDPQCLQPLLTALGDPFESVQREAVIGLGAAKDAKAIPALLPLVNADNIDLRIAMVKALGKIGNLRAIDPLLDIIDQSGGDMRQAAYKALKDITAQDFGEDAAKWRQWWKANERQ